MLDPDYAPSTQEEKIIFNEKHKFMHSVFSTTLQTNREKKFVRENEGDFDAQMVYKKLHGFTQLPWELELVYLTCKAT